MIAFFPKGGKFLIRDSRRLRQQFKPIGGFVEFFETVTDFGDEFRFRPCPIGLPVVGPDGCAGTKNLFAQHLRFG